MIHRYAILLLILSLFGQVVIGQPSAQIMDKVSFDQRLGAQMPLDLEFVNDRGKTVTLRSLANDRPIVLAMVYYRCPMLCTLVLNGVVDTLRAVDFEAGTDYQFVAISIDPNENAWLAADKKRNYLERFGDESIADGWSFLTGTPENIEQVSETIGFHYTYDPATEQFAHPSGFVVLTPDGVVSRYFYGVQYRARDVRFGLVEASAGQIGNAIDELLLLCYHYDPTTGRYGIMVNNALRVGGGATVAGLAWLIFVLIRRERRANEADTLGQHEPEPLG